MQAQEPQGNSLAESGAHTALSLVESDALGAPATVAPEPGSPAATFASAAPGGAAAVDSTPENCEKHSQIFADFSSEKSAKPDADGERGGHGHSLSTPRKTINDSKGAEAAQQAGEAEIGNQRPGQWQASTESPDSFELHLKELGIDDADQSVLGTLTRRKIDCLKYVELESLVEANIPRPVARQILDQIAARHGLAESAPGPKKTWGPRTFKKLEATPVSEEEVCRQIQEIGGSLPFVQTVQMCLKLLADSCGGLLILIADDAVLQEIPYKFIDRKKHFLELLKSEASNIQQEPGKFAKLLSAFRKPYSGPYLKYKDRWDPASLQQLERDLGLELNRLQSLESVPKDGALILTMSGDVVAAATQLLCLPEEWELVKCDGMSCGTRHSALVGTLEQLGQACGRIQVPGAIMAASDSGGIHIGFPTGENDLKVLYVATDAESVDEKGLCKLQFSLSRTSTVSSLGSFPRRSMTPMTPSSGAPSSSSTPRERRSISGRSVSSPPLIRRDDLPDRCDNDPLLKLREHFDKVQLDIGFESVAGSEVQEFRLSRVNQRLSQSLLDTDLPEVIWTQEAILETDPPITLPEETTDERIRELEDTLTQQLEPRLPPGWRVLLRREGSLVLRLPGQSFRHLSTKYGRSPIKIEFPSWCGGTVEVIDVRPGPRHWWSICCDYQDIPNLIVHVRDMAEETFSLELSFEPIEIGEAVEAVIKSHSGLRQAVEAVRFTKSPASLVRVASQRSQETTAKEPMTTESKPSPNHSRRVASLGKILDRVEGIEPQPMLLEANLHPTITPFESKQLDEEQDEEEQQQPRVSREITQAPSPPQVLAVAAIEGPQEQGCLQRFPIASSLYVTGFSVPDWIIEADLSIRELSTDHNDQWCGFSGADGTCITVQHEPQPELEVEISNREEGNILLEGLEWVSSEYVRVCENLSVGRITNQVEYDGAIPQGYMVSVSLLEQSLGIKLCHKGNGVLDPKRSEHKDATWPQRVAFFLPEFDVCPSSMTKFRKGDRAFFACREKSFRYISITDEKELLSLKEQLKDQFTLTREMTLKTNMSITKLLPNTRLLGSKDAEGSPLLTGRESLKLNTTLVFEISPHAILQYNFCNASPQRNCRFDLDYFRVTNLKQSYLLRDRNCPANRSNLRTNIVGVARQVTQNNGQVVFSIDWCSGPDSQIKNDDLILLPRVPGKTSVSDSQRFWKNSDVSHVAHRCPEFDRHMCTICTQNHKNSLLLKCGHMVCDECGSRYRESGVQCPFCRELVEDVVRIY